MSFFKAFFGAAKMTAVGPKHMRHDQVSNFVKGILEDPGIAGGVHI